MGEGTRARGGGSKGFGSGGVGGRGTGPRDGTNFATCRVGQKEEKLRRKDRFRGVGGTGTRDGALVAGEGWGGRRGWMAVPKKGEG